MTNKPIRRAVVNTPKVANTNPGPRITRTWLQTVSRPPEKRIKIRATVPSDCASEASLKSIPPMPSEPANIPTARKSNKAGTPNRPDALLATMLVSSKMAVPNNR